MQARFEKLEEALRKIWKTAKIQWIGEYCLNALLLRTFPSAFQKT